MKCIGPFITKSIRSVFTDKYTAIYILKYRNGWCILVTVKKNPFNVTIREIIDYTYKFGMRFRYIFRIFFVLFFNVFFFKLAPPVTPLDPKHACMLSWNLHPPSSTFTRSSRGTLKGKLKIYILWIQYTLSWSWAEICTI